MTNAEMSLTFSGIYHGLWGEFISAHHVAFHESRGSKMAREIVDANLEIPINKAGICFFSHPTHRVIPIRFVLAEMCAMLAGTNDIETMETYNKGIRKYTNDGVTLGASYGEKLSGQLEAVLDRLRRDPHSRQACCTILQKEEVVNLNLTHIPCNVFLQFLIRDNEMALIVTSRSSDFVTGFSIDTIHWQFLLNYMACSLAVTPKTLCYNIGSLHVYEKDYQVIRDWDVTKKYGVPYSHFIETHAPLEDAIKMCKSGFTGGLSVEQLCRLLAMDEHSIAVCNYNDEMFKLYRNKLER